MVNGKFETCHLNWDKKGPQMIWFDGHLIPLRTDGDVICVEVGNNGGQNLWGIRFHVVRC